MNSQDSKEGARWICLILLLALIVLHLFTLSRYPAPFVDEGWFGSRAWAFRSTQQAFGPLDRGVFDRFSGHWTYFPWLPNWLQSISYSASETPGFIPLRILSFLSGLLLLLAVFSIGKKLGGKRTAWFSIFLVILSRPFFYSSHLGRYDILVAAFGFGAIALALCGGRRKLLHLLAGLAVGAAFEAHPGGAMYGPVVLGLYFLRKSRNFDTEQRTESTGRLHALFRREMWSYIAGVLIGLSIYAALHIVRYPETWMAISRIAGGGTHVPPLLNPSGIPNSFVQLLRLASYTSPYLFPLAIIGALYFIFRRNPENNCVLYIFTSTMILHSLMFHHKLTYYAILFTPAMDLTVAHLFWQIEASAFKRLVKLAAKSVIVFLVACSMIVSVLPLRWNWSEDFYRVQSELRHQAKAGESIMGNQLWWFALPQQDWFSWEVLYYYKRFRGNASLEETFREFRPRLFLLDGHIESFLQNGKSAGYAAQFDISRSELLSILNRHGRIRAEFDGGYYGRIRVFELDWP